MALPITSSQQSWKKFGF